MKTRTAPSLRQRLSIALFTGAAVLALLTALMPSPGHAQEHGAPAATGPSAAGAVTAHPVAPSSEVTASPVKTPATPAAAPVRVEGGSNTIATQIKDAMNGGEPTGKQLNIIIDKNSSSSGVAPGTPPPKNPGAVPQGAKPAASAQMRKAEQQGRAMAQANPRNASGIVIRAKALPQAKKPEPKPKEPPLPEHWAYEGPGGPQNWHKLKPEYAMCGSGKTQSPIAIQDDDTLKGPAESLLLSYKPSKGTVTDTGHGIQVKVYNTDNVLTVRNTKYRLQQFHFHAPAEETINGQSFPLGAHFVHKNDMGQLAVVTVLFETGDPNPLIEKVWTHMPLGENDSVRLPPDLVNVNEILPQDTRYYSYFGSLTTPPCTEGVLWLVLKQTVQISPEQLHMYTQLYDHTARPVQPRNGRTIRDAIALTGDAPAK